ncbi:MAG: hypothetical protein K2W78_10245 [Xanthobacteraceae bacterium]|nr:hypothetical protein [Xanthobacteraceae bacterium]
MPMQDNIHFYVNWAKERIDEMDAALTSLAGKVSELEAGIRTKANKALADMEKRRDEFSDIVKKQTQASEASWVSTKTQLESDWNAFEKQVKTYIEKFGTQIEQQQATFALQSAAQLKAWQETAEKFSDAAKGFTTERRIEIDAAIERMKADADEAQKRFQKLTLAGNESWSALTSALSETRTAFDRANQAARDAFKRAAA